MIKKLRLIVLAFGIILSICISLYLLRINSTNPISENSSDVLRTSQTLSNISSDQDKPDKLLGSDEIKNGKADTIASGEDKAKSLLANATQYRVQNADVVDNTKINDSIDLNYLSHELAEKLQNSLNLYGFKDSDGNKLAVDGVFGKNSKSALKSFLTMNGFDYLNKNAEDLLLSAEAFNINQILGYLRYGEYPDDQIRINFNTYSDNNKYFQLCLNRLGYTDDYGQRLVCDGFVAGRSMTALRNFLSVRGYNYFSTSASEGLMQAAVDLSLNDYTNSQALPQSKMTFTAFIYEDIANINKSKDPFYSMSVLSKLPYIITDRPGELTYIQKKVAAAINTTSQLYGYINMGSDNPFAPARQWLFFDMEKVKEEIDDIAGAGWAGIFIDQFGYDWRNTRAQQNEVVDYAHSKGLKCIANSWHPEDALSSVTDPTFNTNGLPSHLGEGDWVLIESFLSSGDDFTGTASYIDKYLLFKQYSDAMGIKIMVLTYAKKEGKFSETRDDVKISFILAQSLGYNGWWFSKSLDQTPFPCETGPDLDIGNFTTYLTKQAENFYSAETDKYKIEYFSLKSPYMLLIAKDGSNEIKIISTI